MESLRAFLIFHLIYTSTCNDKLKVVYEWKQLDFQFPTPEDRQQAIDNGKYIPENNIPMGLEVYENKLFITATRWRSGVAASLNYIDMNDKSTKSPKLIPYPNWEAHSFEHGTPEIVSPFRIRADRCSRLWVLDDGKIGRFNRPRNVTRYPPGVNVYDLKTDTLLRKYQFPDDQISERSGFSTITVDDQDCQNTFVYMADFQDPGIIVYSWDKNESWKIRHEYFNVDPSALNYTVNGLNFSWSDKVFGIGITRPNEDNFRTLYFHSMSGFNEYAVSTKYLNDKALAEKNPEAFVLLGYRGPNSQACVSFLDQKTGVLFYSLVNFNAVGCWKTSNEVYNMNNQGRVITDNERMIFASDIKVDYNDNLWLISNKLPFWMYRDLDPNEVNFRVFSAPVTEALKGTACEVTP